MDEEVLANGFFGSVLSDYIWALCVVWTTPLVATLGMSLTIPLSMVADMMIHGRHYSAVYMLGSAQILGRSNLSIQLNVIISSAIGMKLFVSEVIDVQEVAQETLKDTQNISCDVCMVLDPSLEAGGRIHQSAQPLRSGRSV
ncbi:hypothetical protein ACLOJK_027656 [Asimina triloba]